MAAVLVREIGVTYCTVRSWHTLCMHHRQFSYQAIQIFGRRHPFCRHVRLHDARQFGSALYVPHDQRQKQYAGTVEVDLDLEQRLKEIVKLHANVTSRGMDLNVYQLHANFKKLQTLIQEKKKKESLKEEIAATMSVLVKKEKTKENEDLKKILISQGRAVREELKSLLPEWQLAEEKVMTMALRLPVDLHDHSPNFNQVLYEIDNKPEFDFKFKNHVDIGRKNNWLSFRPVSPGAYYLKGRLAILELALVHFVSEHLTKSGIEQIQCPDIFKSVVVEGCGHDFNNPHKVFTLSPRASQEKEGVESGSNPDYTYHLAGISPMSFASYLAKMNVSEAILPLQYFTVGRHYAPEVGGTIEKCGLLGAKQQMGVAVFGAARNAKECESIFHQLGSHVVDIYKALGIHARYAKIGIPSLKQYESARVEIQAWIPSLDEYVEVGQLSMCGDFISRRLMTKYSKDMDDFRNRNYIHMVHGHVLNVPPLLASMLEACQTKDGFVSVPKILHEFSLGGK